MRLLTAALPFAALLLSPLAASAQTPKYLPPISSNLQYRTIILQYAHPADILSTMHWQDSRSADSAKLPDGVNRVFALQSNNSLLVEATSDGYKQVQEIVKILDIAPQQIKLTVRFVAVPLSQKQKFDLSNPNQALLQMYTANALFSEPIIAMADDGKPVDFSLPWLFLNQPTQDGNHLERLPSVRLTPRINTNYTVTLSLSTEKPPAQLLETLRTTSSDTATVYDTTTWLPTSEYRVFLFVTPTIVSADAANVGTISIKP